MFRRQHQRGRDRPHDRVDVGVAGALDFGGLAFVDAGENGACDDRERRVGHVAFDRRDVRCALGPPARDLFVGRVHHRRHVGERVAGAEQRAREFALPAPVIAIGCQQAVPISGRNTRLSSRVLTNTSAAFDEDLFNEFGACDPGDQRPLAAIGDDWLLVDSARQRAQRVA